jgi:hypothetical protein
LKTAKKIGVPKFTTWLQTRQKLLKKAYSEEKD